MTALVIGRNVERGTVDKVSVEIRLRSRPHVVAVVGIGHSTYVHVALKHRGRHSAQHGAVRTLTAELPVAAVEVVATIAHTHTLMGTGHQSTKAHHLQFAQYIAARGVRLGHQQSYIASLEMAAQALLQLLAPAQGSHAVPLPAIVRHLEFALPGRVYPVYHHAVGRYLRA